MGKPKDRSRDGNWRFRIGLALFATAGLLFLAGIGMILAGGPGSEGPGWGMVLLAGPPEILCLVAAGILGKGNYQRLSGKVRRASSRSDPSAQASRFRYYTGLAGCLFNGVPLSLYAYVPGILPGGAAKIGILVVADLVFFGSLFFAGGEFWERLRRLFIWEGDQEPFRPSR